MSNASVLILLRVVTLAKFKGLSAPSQEVLNPLNLHFTPQKVFSVERVDGDGSSAKV